MATTETLVDDAASDEETLTDYDHAVALDDVAVDDVSETASASLRARSDETDLADGWLWKLLAGVGVASLVAALAVVALPGWVVPPLDLANGTVRSLRSFALLLGSFVGILGLGVAYYRDPGREAEAGGAESIELPAANPEQPHGRTNEAVGTRLDEHLDVVGDVVDDTHSEAYSAYKIEQSLRGLAVRVVADAADCSLDRAREHVDRGTWTDDVRAAAFVGGDEATSRSLQTRLRDWASGRSFARQVEATVDELAETMGVTER